MDRSLEEKQSPKSRHSWLQIRLRSLLVLVTLLATVFGWVEWELEQRRREKVAIEWVEEMTGTVGFEFEFSVGVMFDRKPDRFFKVNW